MHTQKVSLTPAKLLLLLLLGALFLFAALSSQATVVQRLEIEDLARLSTDVFHGQVVSTETYWNPEHTRIYTGVRLRVAHSFKSSGKSTAQSGDLVTVVQPGGEKDGVKMDYIGRPEFTSGESVVLFTTRTRNNDLTVVALKQGKMTVTKGEVRRDFTGLTVVERDNSGNLRPLASAKSDRLTLDELRTRLARTR